MLFHYRFAGNSTVTSNAHVTNMSFAPDILRDRTFFVGKLNKKIAFREAISALHDVVVSDLRFKPKDKTEYKLWAAQQEELWLAQFIAEFDKEASDRRIKSVKDELESIARQKAKVLAPYYRSQKAYRDYVYKNEMDTWRVLFDPVITVHPDELFFECFSQDESTYGKLGAGYNVFKEVNEFACGTTNIDYSAGLYNEFQKIRDYKETGFTIEPGGFEIQTAQEELYKEVKIDLPDSWVRGFLQVSSAMTLPAIRFDLHPMDIYNFCAWLRRFKEKTGPRYLRYVLEPGRPVRVIFEPWNKEIVCSRSIYTGNKKHDIKVWGRRRLLILERLIPVADKFTVHLLGTGMPSFYVACLGDLNFTLGLSGWTANDWSRAGNFDLMAPRGEVDAGTKQRVFAALKKTWFSDAKTLSEKLGLDRGVVGTALSAYAQAGRAIYDVNKQVYRVRELTKEPLPVEKLRFDNPREELAAQILHTAKPEVYSEYIAGAGTKLSGTITAGKHTYHPQLVINDDEQIKEGTCECSFYKDNKLYKGPCEHMIALRLTYNKTRVVP